MRRWTILGLLVGAPGKGSCYVNHLHPAEHFHSCDIKPAGGRINNPCVDSAFLDPVYQVVRFEYQKIYSGSPILVGRVKAVVNDTTNNHTLLCFNDKFNGPNSIRTASPPDDPKWYRCKVDGMNTDPMVDENFSYHYQQSTNSFDLYQEWLCWNASGVYPQILSARASFNFTVPLDCPGDPGKRDFEHRETLNQIINCTLPSSGAAAATAMPKLSRPVHSFGRIPVIPNTSARAAVPDVKDYVSCVRRSFTYPGWGVSGFKSDGSAISCTLRSQATNATARGSETDSRSSSLTTLDMVQVFNGTASNVSSEVRFDAVSLSIVVNQTWVCRYGNQDIIFKSHGTANIPPNSSSFHVPGTLTAPVDLTPHPPPPPPNVDSPGCTKASNNPSWELREVKLDMTSGNRQGNIGPFVGVWYDAVLNVTLRNRVNNLTVVCIIRSEDLNDMNGPFFLRREPPPNMDRWYACDTPQRHQALPAAKYAISTSIQYNKAKARFAVDQTWFCADEGEDRHIQIQATGSGPLSLLCTTGGSLNEEETICFPASNTSIVLDATPSSLPVLTPLAPHELSTPEPPGNSCTIDSVLSTSWSTSGWRIERRWYYDDLPPLNVSASFFLDNGGFGESLPAQRVAAELAPNWSGWDPRRWYQCAAQAFSDGRVTVPEVPGSVYCSWQLDVSTGYLAVNQSWWCADKNLATPIEFRAVGATYVSLSCTGELNTNETHGRVNCNVVDSKPFWPTELSLRTLGIEK